MSKKKAVLSLLVNTWVLNSHKDLLPGGREVLDLGRFLGMARFCCTWIPNFGEIAKPLWEVLEETMNL